MTDFKSRSLILTFLALLVIVLAYFVVMPSWNKMKTARAELASTEAENKRLEKAEEDIEAFLSRYATLGEEAKKAGLAIPAKSDVGILLANMEELAKASGLVISSVRVNEPTKLEYDRMPPHSVVSLGVEVLASGPYISFRDFLTRLESNLRIIDVELINTTIEENTNMKYQLKFKTYYLSKYGDQ